MIRLIFNYDCMFSMKIDVYLDKITCDKIKMDERWNLIFRHIYLNVQANTPIFYRWLKANICTN